MIELLFLSDPGQWLNCKKDVGERSLSPFLTFLPFSPLSSPPVLPSPPLLRSGLLKTSYGSGEPLQGSCILVYFELENLTWRQHVSLLTLA